ncbi:MAG: hypothetical protein JHC28_02650 [Thermoprotei archaeon]|nr:hypothetical protein [Thermoprotei archaeon]
MPIVQIVVERINGERISEALPPMFRYNTQLSVTKISEDPSSGVGIYEFKVNLTSDPMAASISLGGKAKIQAQGNDERVELFEKRKQDERVAIVSSLIFPHALTSLIIISRELQVPPPIPAIQPQQQGEKKSFLSM